jgi:hypothetical protein
LNFDFLLYRKEFVLSIHYEQTLCLQKKKNLGMKTKISTLLHLNLNIKLAFSFEKLKHLSKKEV